MSVDPDSTGSQTEDDRAQQVSNIAHDLRHCLHVLRMGLTLLKTHQQSENEFAEICSTMENEERRAVELLEQLIGFARGEK